MPISTHLLSKRIPCDLSNTVTMIVAATTIQSHARGRRARSTCPLIGRYGFTLMLRPDTHHLYSFTGSQFVDMLHRWCSTLRGVHMQSRSSCSLETERSATLQIINSRQHPRESVGTRHWIEISTWLSLRLEGSTERQRIQSA